MSATIECPTCHRQMPDDAGAFYHRSECESRSLVREIERCDDPEQLRNLRERLERARYVGD